MKKFLLIVVLVVTMAMLVPVALAQTTQSAGCTAIAGTGGTAPDTITADFLPLELISVTVNSTDGATFDVSIAGSLILDDGSSGDVAEYATSGEGSVSIEITVTGGTGTYTMDCTPDSPPEENDGTLCHFPPGNPAAAHTITVGAAAVETHISKHGDTLGACPEGVETRVDLTEAGITVFIIFETGSIEIYGECGEECDVVLSVAVNLVVDLNLVVDENGEFIDVEHPEDYGFQINAVLLEGYTVVIYYLHPDPEDPTIGVFQINILVNDEPIDDSILVFIDAEGEIVRWTDHSYWDED